MGQESLHKAAGNEYLSANFADTCFFMKKLHIFGLILIAGAIAALLTLMDDISTYDSIESAKKKEGKFVHIIAKVDTTKPVIYDPLKDPNYLAFTAVDSLGFSAPVVYRNAKPTDFEKSQRVVMKGSMAGETFECKEIVLKCPSKYTDEKAATL
jgi:cytochrome c-type biogenesis protein CcmE